MRPCQPIAQQLEELIVALKREKPILEAPNLIERLAKHRPEDFRTPAITATTLNGNALDFMRQPTMNHSGGKIVVSTSVEHFDTKHINPARAEAI